MPQGGLADDVDRELVDRPQRWDIRFIGLYMLAFGTSSSVFDFLTFGALLGLFHATLSSLPSCTSGDGGAEELVLSPLFLAS